MSAIRLVCGLCGWGLLLDFAWIAADGSGGVVNFMICANEITVFFATLAAKRYFQSMSSDEKGDYAKMQAMASVGNHGAECEAAAAGVPRLDGANLFDDESMPEEKLRALAAASTWIRDRRSIKPANMSDRPVGQRLLEILLENANRAPSHGLTEPWRFKIFRGAARARLAAALQRIYRETTVEAEFRPEKFEKLGRNPQLAPVVILLVMKRQTSGKIPRIEEIEAVACAVQNLHLSAAAAGLGGFWSSPQLVYTAPMRDWLSLEEEDECLGIFYLGWPKEGSQWPESRRQSVSEKIEWFD